MYFAQAYFKKYFQDLLLGDTCCFDFSQASTGYRRRCCDQEDGVIAPQDPVPDDQVTKVVIQNDKEIIS